MIRFRAVDETEVLNLEELQGYVIDNLWLAYLLPWQVWPVAFQGMPDGIGDWDKAMIWERGVRREDLCDQLGLGEKEERKPQQEVCCRAG